MTEFKQIIGRGTRIYEDQELGIDKKFFTIMDFRSVTDKFADKDFDGDPVMIKKIANVDIETQLTDSDIFGEEQQPFQTEPEPEPSPYPKKPKIIDAGEIEETDNNKIYVAGVKVSLLNKRIQVLDANGKLMTESLIDYTRRSLLKEFSSLDHFLNRWNTSDKKKALLEEMEQHGILLEDLREEIKKDLDIFDLICHIAWDKPALTRRERANNVKKRDYFSKYEEKARKVLNALLEKYADVGIEAIEELGILTADTTIKEIGRPLEIFKLFGGKEQYLAAVKALETEIYQMAV